MTAERDALAARITAYLTAGGLFNPEMANHNAVRDLLIDCRAVLAAQPDNDQSGDAVGIPASDASANNRSEPSPDPTAAPAQGEPHERMGTHWDGCATDGGPRHYECAVREIQRLREAPHAPSVPREPMDSVRRLMLNRHPILRAIYEVCQAIEACGASVELTHAVTLAGQLSEQAAKILDERDAVQNDQPGTPSAQACDAQAGTEQAVTDGPPDPIAAQPDDVVSSVCPSCDCRFADDALSRANLALRREREARERAEAERNALRQHLHDEHQRHIVTMDERDRLAAELREIGVALNDPAENLIETTAQCVTRLRADRDHLEEDLDGMIRNADFLQSQINTQRQRAEKSAAECERLRADAERYRWLRERMAHQQCGPNVGWTLDMLLPGDDPDAAIDAARAGEGK